jgi:hypothetical protein
MGGRIGVLRLRHSVFFGKHPGMQVADGNRHDIGPFHVVQQVASSHHAQADVASADHLVRTEHTRRENRFVDIRAGGLDCCRSRRNARRCFGRVAHKCTPAYFFFACHRLPPLSEFAIARNAFGCALGRSTGRYQ